MPMPKETKKKDEPKAAVPTKKGDEKAGAPAKADKKGKDKK
jgi:hypothetical protein